MPQSEETVAEALLRNNAEALGDRIRSVLFERVVPGGTQPVAESAAKLAEWIGHEQSIKLTMESAKSSISGVVGAKRAASDELRKAVLLYIETNLTNIDSRDRFNLAAEVSYLFEELQAQLLEDSLKSLSNSSTIRHVSASAKVKFVVPPSFLPTGAANRPDPQLENVRRRAANIVLKHLGGYNESIQSYGSRYIMCFTDKKYLGMWWLSMLRGLVTSDPNLTPKGWQPWLLLDALNRLKEFETKELLTMYVVDQNVLTTPVVVFDPDREDCVAYTMFQDKEAVITSFIPRAHVYAWKRLFHAIHEERSIGTHVQFDEFRDYLTGEYRFMVPGTVG